MEFPLWVEKNFLKMSDWVSNFLPQKKPSPEKLKDLKIISHRGHHDNLKLFENTLESFKAAKELGAWGIEFDIRWSRDGIPVVFHDKNTLRLFGKKENIGELNYLEIKESFPLIPTFEEVVNTFGKNIHLMIELKEFFDENKKERFKSIVNNLIPETDYHLLSLDPAILDQVDFIPGKGLVPVAETNSAALSEIVLRKVWGGICGHYFLFPSKFIKKHHQLGQLIGTGHVNSKNCLYREINRGVDWIFTNEIKKLIP